MRRSPPYGSAVLVLSLLPCATAGAQSKELFRVYGPAAGGAFGASVAAAGDADSDGVADFLVGAPKDGGNGRASLRSGVDGHVIHDWSGATGSAFGAAVASTGDLDGDGVLDVLVGATAEQDSNGRDTGAVHVYSGASGALVRSHYGSYASERFGAALAELGDLDADGVADYAIGGPGASFSKAGAGTLYVVSGKGGKLLTQFDGTSAGDELGSAVASTGDLDGDGVPDLAVGAPLRNRMTVVDAGAVFVYSGQTQTVLHRFLGTQTDEQVGRVVAGGVEIDGDGIPDLLVGVPGWDGALAEQGRVEARSGADGHVLWTREGLAVDDGLGAAIAFADRDGDGVAELLATAGRPGVSPFRVERLAPTTGALLHSRPDPSGGDLFGTALAVVGDLDGDHVADVAIGTPDGDTGGGTDDGVVYLFSGAKLWFNADPKAVAGGATLSTTVRQGLPGNLMVRAVVDVNGTPLFIALIPVAQFDPAGFSDYLEVVPAGLSGLTVTMRAYAVNLHGRLDHTNDEVIELL